MLEVKIFSDIYRNKRVLLTGHTGFKGSWLSLWLHEMGAEVTGVSLSPEDSPNHWDLLKLGIDDHRVDIRNFESLLAVFEHSQPDIVFHLAAQPLVRRSYKDPLETWSSNVMGTANVLEACRHVPGLRAVIVVTTDKCYENVEWPWGYRENDRLGGHDPYSASKAAAEFVVSSYRDSFFCDGTALLATARAGNVIGGGDWSVDRLIPDLVRSLNGHGPLEIRSPHATRPWQHVLESISGYLLLGKGLLEGTQSWASAWNFGPDLEGNRTVGDILGKLQVHWSRLDWKVSEKIQPHEATLLYLDSSKVRTQMQWVPVWPIDTALEKTAHWYKTWLEEKRVVSLGQLFEYVSDAQNAKIGWARE